MSCGARSAPSPCQRVTVTSAGAAPSCPSASPGAKRATPWSSVTVRASTSFERLTSATSAPGLAEVSRRLRTATVSPSLPEKVEMPKSEITNHCTASPASEAFCPEIPASRI